MNYSTIMNRVREHYEHVKAHYPDNEIFFTALYGSQNYGTDTEYSDVDTKTIVIPTLRQCALGEIIKSVDYKIDNELSCVKDVRAMFKEFLKANINFLEILYTEYVYVNPKYQEEYDRLIEMRDKIALADIPRMVHSAAGMTTQKKIAMEKYFESKKEVLARYSYDPKQLSSLVRIEFFLTDFLNSFYDFEKSLKPNPANVNKLKQLKLNPVDLETARAIRDKSMADIELSVKIIDSYNLDKYTDVVRELLNDLVVDIVTK